MPNQNECHINDLITLKGPQGKFKIFKSTFPMPYLYHELNRQVSTH